MLILGIESATAAGRAAPSAATRACSASAHSARGRRHAESLTPAIEFVCRQARIELTEIGAVAVDVGPGLFTGLRVGVATAKAMAQALRVPDDRRLQPRPAGLPGCASPTGSSPRSSTPAGASCSTPSTARCPAACSGSPSPGSARPTTCAAELQAHRRGRAARGRRRAPLPRRLRAGWRGSSSPTHGLRHPSARVARAAGPRPGPARGVGAAVGGHAALPAQARRRDQLGHPRRRIRAPLGPGRSGPMAAAPDAGRCAATGRRSRRCAAATCRRSCGSSSQVYPRPWSLGLFLGELADQRRPALPVAQVGAPRSSATPG